MFLKFCIIPLFKFNSLQKAFHDCVGPDGCDGCLNTNDGENAGLADIIEKLSVLREGNRRTEGFTVRTMTISNFLIDSFIIYRNEEHVIIHHINI